MPLTSANLSSIRYLLPALTFNDSAGSDRCHPLALLKRGSCGVAEEAVQRGDHLRPLADCAADPLDRSRAHVADGKNARHRGFQRRYRLRFALVVLRTGHHETCAVDRHAAALE